MGEHGLRDRAEHLDLLPGQQVDEMAAHGLDVVRRRLCGELCGVAELSNRQPLWRRDAQRLLVPL